MNLRSLALVAAFFLAACNPTGATTTTGTSTTVTTEATTSTTGEAPTSTTLPAGTEELPEELRAEISRLTEVTEELRGLEFVTPPTITVVTADELAERVRQQIEEDYEEVDVDQALYILLGLVEPDFNLRQTISDLYGEQVAGYYDGENQELVVPALDNEFTMLQQVTLVHELTHSLTDQVLDFHAYFDELHEEDRFDEASAFQALVEGDASLTEVLFVQQMSPAEQQEFLEEALQGVDDTVFSGVPQFIQDSLLFPYETGFFFVSELFNVGGPEAVDQAYTNPPRSTEQVLDPSRYPDDIPMEVSLLPELVVGYQLEYGSTWGELGFRLLFDQELGGNEAAATGWGGDSYNVFYNGVDVAMVLRYIGDTGDDAVEIFAALREYAQAAMAVGEPIADGSGFAFTGDDYAFVSQVGDEVAWVVAGDPAIGAQLRAELPDF